MSDRESPSEDHRAALADAFDANVDPLAEHASTFEELDVDPFELFFSEALDPVDPAPGTVASYEQLFRMWREHMAREGRHPACPNEQHVHSFVEYCLNERSNKPHTARTKLHRLKKVFEYWQADPLFPHPTDYDPFALALSKLDLDRPPVKQPPRLSVSELADVIRTVTHVRDRAIVVMQLKLGLRASEVCNLRLSHVHLADEEVKRGYPSLGSHERLARRPNAVFIPSRYEQPGNKSRRHRVLPLDSELQELLRVQLLTRPDTGAPWVFQTKTTHNQLDQEYVNRVWTTAFHPEYAETPEYRAVTSHYGRHRFTTYWQVEHPVNREVVQYMRGDTIEGDATDREAIDDYVHTYYEDIESLYREQIYQFGIRSM
ncbi:tyrosine-type recombinase/integrase [Halobacteriaceae archaeon GCM10025711]